MFIRRLIHIIRFFFREIANSMIHYDFFHMFTLFDSRYFYPPNKRPLTFPWLVPAVPFSLLPHPALSHTRFISRLCFPKVHSACLYFFLFSFL